MTTAKELFQKRPPDGSQSLAQWWVSIARDDRFLMVLSFCRAHLMESKPNAVQIEGAEMAINALLTLSDAEDLGAEMPTPGISHDFYPTKTDNVTTPN